MAANPVPTSTLTLTTEKTETGAVIHCSGKIVMENTDELRQLAREQIAHNKEVVLDFTGITYLDSSGLGMIVGLLLAAKRSGCQLKLVNLTPRVREIFTLTRLTEALEGDELLGLTPD